MITLDEVKQALRITNKALDDDIMNTLEAGKIELKRVGIDLNTIDNDLTDCLLKTWCKWQQNYNERGEQYEKIFRQLEASVALDGGESIET